MLSTVTSQHVSLQFPHCATCLQNSLLCINSPKSPNPLHQQASKQTRKRAKLRILEPIFVSLFSKQHLESPHTMALKSMGYWKSMASRFRGAATYATSTSPKLKAYAPTADQFGHQHLQETKHSKKSRGEFVPVYVALGMIALSVSLGLYTAKQQVFYSPTVRVKKKTRETIPEVVDPDKVVDEADKFAKRSFFRKVAHIQEFDNGLQHDPMRKDAFVHKPPHVETLRDVGVDPKQL